MKGRRTRQAACVHQSCTIHHLRSIGGKEGIPRLAIWHNGMIDLNETNQRHLKRGSSMVWTPS